MEIVWKRGFESLYKGASAQKVAKEIQEIGDSATPEQILEKAKNENTELHKCFEWDNSVAAERWRLQQARLVVCHIVFKNPEEKKEHPQIRCFFNNDRKEGYKATKFILQKENEYKKLLNTAYGELSAFKRKYSTLSELEGVFEEIDKLFY